jgi:transcriptional regulator GlxA family with amidase domain
VLSVCTGALVLAAAGLLDGLEATTWHGAFDRLRAAAPGARVREGVRFVDNGRIVTSAGVSAGIDAALHLVGRLDGPERARAVARYMEYDLVASP